MYGIIVHGGAGGTSPLAEEGCRRAAEIGMDILRRGGSSLDAVIAAVRFLEDSGDFNAGTGSVLRADGKTIEMDAVVANSSGMYGAVAAVRDIKNPVLLALALSATTTRFLVGDGARAFARQMGLEDHPGPTPRALERAAQLRALLMGAYRGGTLSTVAPGWDPVELQQYGIIPEGDGALFYARDCDTVGAIGLDRQGVFAIAGSTGGSGLMRLGRVGDVTADGAGHRLGSFGGVLATGVGEAIMARRGAEQVARLIEEMGFAPQDACAHVALKVFPPETDVGFIAMNRNGVGHNANCPMSFHYMTDE
ncbi:MAG: isoaspartyl peptidase/L-asparaginase [Candidatus Wildermuthbacteria bacterium]|nr:isoaspartyl peptidase/L-asparaginase [Candidatus Wildermuthbacteria bacterium]